MKEIEVEVAPEEILERVDEMLAWMAIASEASKPDVDNPLLFSQKDLFRASPVVDLGNDSYGVLTPKGFRAPAEPQCHFDEGRYAGDDRRVAEYRAVIDAIMTNRSGIAERPSYARMIEGVGDEYALLSGKSGDDVSDNRLADGEDFDCAEGTYKDIVYRLESAYLAEKEEAHSSRRLWNVNAPISVLIYQCIGAFRDGRAASGRATFGWYPKAGLVSLQSMKPVRADPVLAIMANLFKAQERRKREWTIELALGEERTGIGLQSDAVGARALANELRHQHDTRSGRRVLVHWVNEHMRRRRDASLDPSFVRAHLRGRTQIRIGSRYVARIYPSRLDIERACNGARFDRDARP